MFQGTFLGSCPGAHLHCVNFARRAQEEFLSWGLRFGVWGLGLVCGLGLGLRVEDLGFRV